MSIDTQEIDNTVDYVHEWAHRKGFWDGPGTNCEHPLLASGDYSLAEHAFDQIAVICNAVEEHRKSAPPLGREKSAIETLMLVVTELVELATALDAPSVSEHIPEYTAAQEELADCVIRLFDIAGAYKLELGPAIEAKMAFNETRPTRHGKAY